MAESKAITIDLIPVEILTVVFDFAYGGPRYSSKKLILGAVCSKWREIAWSFPSMWVDLKIIGNDYSNTCHLFELHAQNARNLLLVVDLNNYVVELLSFRELFNCILVKYASRVQSLKLQFLASDAWEFINELSIRVDFPLLKVLECHNHRKCLKWFDRIPHLSHLSSCFVNPDKFPVDRITSLVLLFVHPDDALYILSRCPNLVTFEASPGYLNPPTLPF